MLFPWIVKACFPNIWTSPFLQCFSPPIVGLRASLPPTAWLSLCLSISLLQAAACPRIFLLNQNKIIFKFKKRPFQFLLGFLYNETNHLHINPLLYCTHWMREHQKLWDYLDMKYMRLLLCFWTQPEVGMRGVPLWCPGCSHTLLLFQNRVSLSNGLSCPETSSCRPGWLELIEIHLPRPPKC